MVAIERVEEREKEIEKERVSLRILENFLNVLHLVEKEYGNFFFYEFLANLNVEKLLRK